MPAFVVLTPEEAETVRVGSLPDPTYRPFPSGRRARREREEEIRYGEELADILMGREPKPIALDGSLRIERSFASYYWTRHALELVLLLVPIAPMNPALEIVALARAVGGPLGRAGGTRRVTLGPWDQLSPSVPLDDVARQLTTRQQEQLRRIIGSGTRPLPPGLGKAFTQALTHIVPDYIARARSLTSPGPRARRVRESLERRDANATALSILTPRWRSLRPEANPVPPQVALNMDQLLNASATENDLISSDAAVFPDWERAGRPVAGWWEFRYGTRRMWIKNINVSRAENATGADLVYVRTDPEALVLVQYKRLSRAASGELYMPHDPRLAGQLERMLSYHSNTDLPRALPDHRIGPGFAFVKFIDNQAQTGLSEDELTRGWYLPAEYARDMLSGEPQGPKGGRVYYIAHERALNPSVFVGLVHDCWIGSRGEVTSILARILHAPSATITLAVDQPAP